MPRPGAGGDSFVVDLSNYKDRVGQRVTPGRYRVLVEDAEMDTAKSGNKMINLWLRVEEGEHQGATIIDRLVLTENSLFRVVGFMQAIGLPTPKKRLALNLRNFIGRHLIIDVEDGDPYNGRVKSEVRGYSKIEGDSPSAGEDLDDLGDLQDAPSLEGLSEFMNDGSVDDDNADDGTAGEEVPEETPGEETPGEEDDAEVDLDNLKL